MKAVAESGRKYRRSSTWTTPLSASEAAAEIRLATAANAEMLGGETEEQNTFDDVLFITGTDCLNGINSSWWSAASPRYAEK